MSDEPTPAPTPDIPSCRQCKWSLYLSRAVEPGIGSDNRLRYRPVAYRVHLCCFGKPRIATMCAFERSFGGNCGPSAANFELADQPYDE